MTTILRASATPCLALDTYIPNDSAPPGPGNLRERPGGTSARSAAWDARPAPPRIPYTAQRARSCSRKETQSS
ncbi:hypothetical protein GCM10010207_09560 [Streptomyces atratus]|nr:hypothetical protein GCM10010207_09560 [Streptomyces atratus]